MSLKKVAKLQKIEPVGEFKFGLISPKGLDSIDNSNARLNIWYGSVRSSKTISSILRWIEFVQESPYNEFLMSGRTRETLYRNVLYPLFKILNHFKIKYYHDKFTGILYIGEKVIWILGFSNEVVKDKVIGMTLAGWYADEINTYPKQAVENTLDRLSLEGAKAFWTYNPDVPKHYIPTDYTYNESKLAKGMVKAWHFTLEDNLNLPQEYIDDLLERYPPGTLGYKRKILGIEAIPDGAIYERFSEASHTFKTEDAPYGDYSYYVIGTDEGRGNVVVCGLFGIKRQQTGDEYHLLDEVYWDVSKHDGRQLTSEELIYGDSTHSFKGAIAMLNNRPLTAFITPHEAATLRAYLLQQEYHGKPMPVVTYTPKTIDAIEQIQDIIAKNRFKLNIDNCPNTFEQLQSYVWDPSALRRGESKPLKTNDHCPDMIRGPIIGSTNLTTNPFSTSPKRNDFAEPKGFKERQKHKRGFHR